MRYIKHNKDQSYVQEKAKKVWSQHLLQKVLDLVSVPDSWLYLEADPTPTLTTTRPSSISTSTTCRLVGKASRHFRSTSRSRRSTECWSSDWPPTSVTWCMSTSRTCTSAKDTLVGMWHPLGYQCYKYVFALIGGALYYGKNFMRHFVHSIRFTNPFYRANWGESWENINQGSKSSHYLKLYCPL